MMRSRIMAVAITALIIAAVAGTVATAVVLPAPAYAARSLSWSAPKAIHSGGGLVGLACPSASLCVAADNGGNVITSTDPGAGAKSTWTKKHVEPYHGDDSFNDISCPSASLCVAVDGRGNAVSSTNPAAGRSAAWKRVHIDEDLWAVSCQSATLCLGVGKAGEVLSSTAPTTSSWTESLAEAGQIPWYGASPACPSAALCVLVNGAGNVVSSANPAAGQFANWTKKNVDGNPVSGHGAPLDAVSCPSVTLCVATDLEGNVISSTDPSRRASAKWTRKNVLGRGQKGGYYYSFEDIACPSASLCVGVGEHGKANEIASSRDPAAGAKAAWTVRHVKGLFELKFVSCASASLCFAADLSGNVLVGR